MAALNVIECNELISDSHYFAAPDDLSKVFITAGAHKDSTSGRVSPIDQAAPVPLARARPNDRQPVTPGHGSGRQARMAAFPRRGLRPSPSMLRRIKIGTILCFVHGE